ncbi:phage baseplate assembly protein [Pseudomonas reactans]|nr:phage baseplate assembly protein [Pseudomonas reactans]
MSTERNWQRMLGPVWRRLRLLVSRGVLQLTNDNQGIQSVQVTLLGDAPAWAERFQQYGLTSNPHPGAEVVVAAIGGARAHLVAISVDDRRFRLASLKKGEVALYDDLGQAVHLTREGIVVKGGGLPLRFEGCPLVTMDGDLDVAGQVRDGVSTMQAMRDIYNAHTDTGDGPEPRMD